MEAGFIILVIMAGVIGLVIGILIGKTSDKNKATQGILNVDYSDPDDGPYLFLELNTPIAEIVSREQAIFDVRNIASNTHE